MSPDILDLVYTFRVLTTKRAQSIFVNESFVSSKQQG